MDYETLARNDGKKLNLLELEVIQHISNIDSQLSEKRALWMTLTDQYKALVANPNKNFPWPNCSNVFVPEVTNQITTLCSFVLGSMFDSKRPAFKVKNYFVKDQELVEEFERFLDFYLKTVQGLPAYWRRFLPYTILLGTHIAKMRFDFDPSSGYPRVIPYGVPLQQFYTYPQVLDLRASPFVSDVSYLPNWELYAWAEKQQPGTFDQKRLDSVYEQVQHQWDQGNQYNDSKVTAYDRLPPNYCPIFDIYMVTTLGEQRATPYKLNVTYEGLTQKIVGVRPYEDREVPYRPVFWRRDEDGFFGIGAGELVWRLQNGLNTIFNQGIDSGTIANIKMFRVSKGANIDPEEPIYPGRQVIADQGDIEAIALGDIPPSVPMLIGALKQAIEATLATPPVFQGMPDQVAKSGVEPGVVQTQLNQSAGRLETFLQEFESGNVELAWYTLSRLAKEASYFEFALPSEDSKKSIFEWLQSEGQIPQEGDLVSVIQARVEPEKVATVSEIFTVEQELYTKSRFELRPIRKELDQASEQQASLLLSQLVHAYIQKIMEFASTLSQLKQQPGQPTNELQTALMKAWKATNYVMRRVLSAFAIEDAGEIIAQLEEVVSGLEAGIPELPAGGIQGMEAATGMGPEGAALGLGATGLGGGITPAMAAGAAQGIRGGRPQDELTGAPSPIIPV